MPPKSKKPTRSPEVTVIQDAGVYYEKSVTKNLGNYESAKVTVGVTLPVDPDKDTIAKVKKTLETADKIITEELEVQLAEIVGGE